eukprot:scaffold34440_cov45-Cyclotella_meneghiniana.AAC.4
MPYVQLTGDESVAIVHSVAEAFSPPQQRCTFLERIRALPNGLWIYESLLSNSLVMMSDGAYELLLAEGVCSCAIIVMCLRTGNRASLTWLERSDRLSADNYRASCRNSGWHSSPDAGGCGM